MRCPKCKGVEDRVIDSRPVSHFTGIRRRRVCLQCEHRFTTYEQIERADLRVIKRDGRSEAFDRQKLYSGITKACEKRPVSLETIDRAVSEIINEIEGRHLSEVPAKDLGARVMEKLHAIDAVAYVRYASVYRQFQDVGEFIDEIQMLERRPFRSRLQPELFSENPD